MLSAHREDGTHYVQLYRPLGFAAYAQVMDLVVTKLKGLLGPRAETLLPSHDMLCAMKKCQGGLIHRPNINNAQEVLNKRAEFVRTFHGGTRSTTSDCDE